MEKWPKVDSKLHFLCEHLDNNMMYVHFLHVVVYPVRGEKIDLC